MGTWRGANFGTILGGALIGGAAGAIGAGVGNAVGGAGFFGSKAVATTMGFGKGFASGFAGGFAGGFVGGAGNAWLGGASFGQGLVSGLKAGAIGGAAGGLINGVSSGIRAVKHGRDFWSGEKWNEIVTGYGGEGAPFSDTEEFLREWDVDESMKLKQVNQADAFDCGIACKKSVDSYYGNTNQSAVNSKYFQIAKANGGLSDMKMLQMYREGGYSGNLYAGKFNKKDVLSWMVGEMKSNHAVQGSFRVSGGYHASLVTRVKYLSDFSKFKIFIMNPSGTSVRVKNFNTYHKLFSIWK